LSDAVCAYLTASPIVALVVPLDQEIHPVGEVL
jgi:hypothetical protein